MRDTQHSIQSLNHCVNPAIEDIEFPVVSRHRISAFKIDGSPTKLKLEYNLNFVLKNAKPFAVGYLLL